MNNIKIFKSVSFCFAVLMGINSFLRCPQTAFSSETEEYTVSELEEMKAENEQKIAEYQRKTKELKGRYDIISENAEIKKEYENSLNEKIALQNQNISLIVEQMNVLDDEISRNMDDIEELDGKINIRNESIEKTREEYKARLRVSYMSGNEKLSAVLTGSLSFSDILSKFELVGKVAEHDNSLLEKLDSQLKEMKRLTEELNAEHDSLSANLENISRRREEYEQKLSQLSADLEETQNELKKLNEEKQSVEEDIRSFSDASAELEEAEKHIAAAISAANERKRQESIAESRRVSEFVSVSESIAAETQSTPAVTTVHVTEQKPVTEAPVQNTPVPETPAVTQAEPETTDSDKWYWPVPGYTYHSSYFGYRDWDNSNHKAIDICGGIDGASVYAAESGTVEIAVNSCTHNYGKDGSCGCGFGYGNHVVLSHDDGRYTTVYAHCSQVLVYAGQHVSKGQLIGYVGSTGYSSGPHLHFEVRDGVTKVDPDSFSYQNYG